MQTHPVHVIREQRIILSSKTDKNYHPSQYDLSHPRGIFATNLDDSRGKQLGAVVFFGESDLRMLVDNIERLAKGLPSGHHPITEVYQFTSAEDISAGIRVLGVQLAESVSGWHLIETERGGLSSDSLLSEFANFCAYLGVVIFEFAWDSGVTVSSYFSQLCDLLTRLEYGNSALHVVCNNILPTSQAYLQVIPLSPVATLAADVPESQIMQLATLKIPCAPEIVFTGQHTIRSDLFAAACSLLTAQYEALSPNSTWWSYFPQLTGGLSRFSKLVLQETEKTLFFRAIGNLEARNYSAVWYQILCHLALLNGGGYESLLPMSDPLLVAILQQNTLFGESDTHYHKEEPYAKHSLRVAELIRSEINRIPQKDQEEFRNNVFRCVPEDIRDKVTLCLKINPSDRFDPAADQFLDSGKTRDPLDAATITTTEITHTSGSISVNSPSGRSFVGHLAQNNESVKVLYSLAQVERDMVTAVQSMTLRLGIPQTQVELPYSPEETLDTVSELLANTDSPVERLIRPLTTHSLTGAVFNSFR